MSGLAYFVMNERYHFDTASICSSCVVIHNNWIRGKEAKVYRFREMLMWFYDGPDRYYSSSERLYLTFPTQKDFFQDFQALYNALAIGFMLNRVVILPKLHCRKGNSWCPLHYSVQMSLFDNEFGGLYRESSFFAHPKVPALIKEMWSEHWNYTVTIRHLSKIHSPVQPLAFQAKTSDGAADTEIITWLKHRTDLNLIYIPSISNIFRGFVDKTVTNRFNKRIQNAFYDSKYSLDHLLP